MVLIMYMVVILDNFESDLNFHVFFHYPLPAEADGTIVAGAPHDAIPQEDIEWMYDLMYNGDEPVPFHKAIHLLRRKHFPFFYDPHPWVPG